LVATRNAKEIMPITVEGPGGATVEFPDGTSAETINTVMTEHFGGGAKKDTPSGSAAGMVHGVGELVNGPAETLKRFAGVGEGRKDDPNYVPANVTNGSFDPRKWNYDQLPQKVAELAPSVGEAALGAGAGSKIGGVAGAKGKLLGGLIGAMVPNLFNTAGDTAREVTAARTGNPDDQSSTADLVRGGATAGAASLAGALLPTRLAGINPSKAVGAPGVASAVGNYLGTTALGGVGGVGSDAITQLGTKGSVDPTRLPEAFVGGAATGATLASPRLVGDSVRSGTLAKFGGDNLEATQNVSTRLQTASEKLGNAKSDENALTRVVGDLKNELSDAVSNVRKQTTLSPEADNSLVALQRGEKISKAEVQRIKSETAGTPDGDNVGFLAHSLHVADLMAERGGHSNRGWAGGVSGVMDKNLGFLLNPTRLAGGAAATALGMHLLGTSNPLFGASLAGTYGVARVADGITGMRSPAKTFAQHFADMNAQLRKPTTPTPPPPPAPPTPGPAQPWGPVPPLRTGPTGPNVAMPAPQGGAAGPWGPKPLPTTSVPPVAPPAPPAPITPGTVPWAKPQINELWNGPNPLALSMLKDKLKTGLPSEPAPAPAPAPELWKGPSPIAAKMLAANIKATTEAANAPPAPPKAPGASPKVADTTPPTSNDVPKDVMAGSKKLMAGIAKANKLKEKADAVEAKIKAAELKAAIKASKAAPAATSLNSAATPKSMADVLASVTEAAAPQPKKITKKAGKVKTEEPALSDVPYAPLAEEHLYPKGITPKEYADLEASSKNIRSDVYRAKAEASETHRAGIASDLKAKHPKAARAIDWLHRELQRVGTNPAEINRAVKYAQENVTSDVATAMEAFKK
jgi:hypothetical protein